MKYAILVENDDSKWKDETGVKYHFPNRYLKNLQPGTKVIYYKSKLKNKSNLNKRLTSTPHYFGAATIGKQYKDPESEKNDYYIDILDFIQFSKAVPIRHSSELIEVIPTNRKSNYWRDGVRMIDAATYFKILSLAGMANENESKFNDYLLYSSGFESDLEEGEKIFRFTSYYERNPAIRQQALEIHGFTCLACKFNFKEFYGDWGEGFIHVHHIKPISQKETKQIVNPKTDLVVLCANCHSMVHRKKDKTLTLIELINLIQVK